MVQSSMSVFQTHNTQLHSSHTPHTIVLICTILSRVYSILRESIQLGILQCYNPWGVQTFVVLFITEGQYTVLYRGTSVGRQQRRCDSIRCKCSQFLMNMIIRTVCVHFTIHIFQITSSFSCCLKYNFLYT